MKEIITQLANLNHADRESTQADRRFQLNVMAAAALVVLLLELAG